MATPTSEHPLVTTLFMSMMTFDAPMWVLHSRPLEHQPELSWVHLVIDLDMEMFAWVLAVNEHSGFAVVFSAPE